MPSRNRLSPRPAANSAGWPWANCSRPCPPAGSWRWSAPAGWPRHWRLSASKPGSRTYDRPDALDAALAGIGRVLLIFSNDLGRRAAQHRDVIDAAKRAGVGLLAYTSVLHADTSPLGLAGEHRDTEALLRESSLPLVLLRNGWYTENYTAPIPAALARGAVSGGAGEGRIASAARTDYAAAAVAVLTAPQDMAGRTFELAGDKAYSLPGLAAEAARRSGRPVGYTDLAEADHKAALIGAGLPGTLASLIADSDTGAPKGALLDEGRQLSALYRPADDADGGNCGPGPRTASSLRRTWAAGDRRLDATRAAPSSLRRVAGRMEEWARGGSGQQAAFHARVPHA